MKESFLLNQPSLLVDSHNHPDRNLCIQPDHRNLVAKGNTSLYFFLGLRPVIVPDVVKFQLRIFAAFDYNIEGYSKKNFRHDYKLDVSSFRDSSAQSVGLKSEDVPFSGPEKGFLKLSFYELIS